VPKNQNKAISSEISVRLNHHASLVFFKSLMQMLMLKFTFHIEKDIVHIEVSNKVDYCSNFETRLGYQY